MTDVPRQGIETLLAGIRADEGRNRRSLFLTANETLLSATARSFMSSELTDRYYTGAGDIDAVVSNDFGPFMSRGLPGVAAIVAEAMEAAEAMLRASAVNINCLSGVHAMMCAILATTKPGDIIMSVHIDHGGHFGTKGIVERTGRIHIPTSYSFDSNTFDLEHLTDRFHSAGATALYLDTSYYLSPHDVSALREALGEKAIIIYDASHTIGLIMGGCFQAPLSEGADVVCGNTHKTLPGPHKGLIAFRDAHFATAANAVIDGGLYSSPHLMSIVPLAVTILEMELFGAAYARQIIANSNALGQALSNSGFDLRRARNGTFSENHQVHVFSEGLGRHRDLYGRLSKSNIAVGFDNSLGGRVYMRLGTQEATRRGMCEPEMATIAELVSRALAGEGVADQVADFVANFARAAFSFDSPVTAGRHAHNATRAV